MQRILTQTFGHALAPRHLALLSDFLRFGSVGFVGFLVDTIVVYGLRAWVGLYVAGLLSFLVAATVTWGLNRIWTFRGRGGGPMYRQWVQFLAANSLGFVLNRGTYFSLVTFSAVCAEHPILAIVGGVIMGMFANFHLSRKHVFR